MIYNKNNYSQIVPKEIANLEIIIYESGNELWKFHIIDCGSCL